MRQDAEEVAEVERATQGSEGDEDIRPLAPTKEVRRHLVRGRVRARGRVRLGARIRATLRVSAPSSRGRA